jgi:hypothetical protein
VLVGAEPARGEYCPEFVPRIVDGLVNRAAGGVQALGEHVNGDIVDRHRDQYLALAGSELAVDPFL